MRRCLSSVLLSCCLAATLAACGSSDDPADAGQATASAGPAAVDVGTTKIETDPARKPRLALFLGTTVIPYGIEARRGAEKAAAEAGADITVFDGKFDPTTQVNQMTQALTAKKYDAFVINAVLGEPVCNVATRQAPKQGVLVTAFATPLCGRDLKAGEGIWSPGTVTQLVNSGGYEAIRLMWQRIADANPGAHRIIDLTGAERSAPGQAWVKARDEVLATRPDLKVLATAFTDYTTPQGFSKTQTLLQAHPDADLLVTGYTPLTVGAVRAIEQAGRSDDMKVYDLGATKVAVQMIKEGRLTASQPGYPFDAGYTATKAAIDAWNGKRVPRTIPNDGHDGEAPFVTRETMDEYTPQY